MTIGSIETKKTYMGDGVNKTFPCPFPVYKNEYVHAILSTGTGLTLHETRLLYATDYVYSPSLQAVVTTTAVPNNTKITVYLQLPFTQELDLQDQGRIAGHDLEKGYDKLTLLVMQIAEELTRAVKVPIADEQSADAMREMIINGIREAIESSITSCQCAEMSVEAIEIIRHIVETLPQFASNVQCYFGFRIDGTNLIIDKTESGDSIRAEDYDCVVVLPAETILSVDGGRIIISLPFAPVEV